MSFFQFVSQMEQSVTEVPELESPSNSSQKTRVETCHACSVEEAPFGPSAKREKEAEEKHLSLESQPSPSQAEGTEGTFQDTSTGGSSCQEFLRLSPGKEAMKEMSRVKREVCWLNFSVHGGMWIVFDTPKFYNHMQYCSSAGYNTCLPVLSLCVCMHMLIAVLGAAHFFSCHA